MPEQKDVTTLRFVGMNNMVDPASLSIDDGEHALLLNVDADNRGNIVVRDELVRITATPTHSLFCGNGLLLGVRNQSLCILHGTTAMPIFPLTTNAPLSYAVCSNDYIVFSNGVDIGYVYSGAAEQLPDVDVVETIDATGTQVMTFQATLPPGELVAFFRGRIYSAKGTSDGCLISYSDAFELHSHEIENYLYLMGEPTLLAATDDTLWASNGRSVVAFIGTDPGEMQEIVKIPFGAVKNTAEMRNAEALGLQGFSGKVVIATTTNGIYILGNGGQVLNLSEGKVALPQAFSGAAGIVESRGTRKYITCLTTTQGSFNSFPTKEPLYD